MSNRLSSKNSNRVKWVPDTNLCQVKLFLSDDCPSQVGSKAKDHLQAKTSWMLHPNEVGFDDPPPGFGGKGFLHTLRASCIPQIKWKCPPRFILNGDWHVVAGEQSEESAGQKHREMRVLEAVYPRASSIPPSPTISPDSVESDYDDHETPLVPLTPFEEEDAVDHESPKWPVPVTSKSATMDPDVVMTTTIPVESHKKIEKSMQSNSPVELEPTVNVRSLGTSTGLEADVVAAASAAFTAIMKSREKGSMIDTDLLINILTDPKMIEKLSNDFIPSTTKKLTSMSESNPVLLSASNTLPISEVTQFPTVPNANPHALLSKKLDHVNQLLQALVSTPSTLSDLGSKMSFPSLLDRIIPQKVEESEPPKTIPSISSSRFPGSTPTSMLKPEPEMVSSTGLANRSLHPDKHVTGRPLPGTSHSSTSPLVVKDTDYYRSLVKLHGMGSQEAREKRIPQYNSGVSELIKKRKPCKYFNSSAGCKKGSKCPFQHDSLPKLRAGSIPYAADSSKRIKFSRELA